MADRGAAPAGPEREAAVKQFTYLLNAFEDAAQAEKPAQAGYLAKRQAVLKFVADLVATGERPAEAPSEADVWNYCPVCGKALEHLTPENRGIRPLPGVGLLTRHANTTPMCPLPLRSGAAAPVREGE